MKREIKCRIWRGEHTDENPYDDDYGYEYFDLSKKVKECFSGWVELRLPNKVDAIEQYTGLKDKNGKEIYEGDIVEYSWDFCGTKRKNNYVVEWLSGKVEHYPYSVDSGFTLPDSVDGYMVIGNIHENPELLEQDNAKD